MEKKQMVKLTENDLKKIIVETVNNLLNERSYDSYGNFDEKAHNDDLRIRLKEEVQNINESINGALSSLNNIAQMATDDEIKNRTRVIMNA